MADITLAEDIVLTDDILYHNNTFNLKALNDTLEKLSVTNYWNLYQLQRSRLKIKRFDIPFDQFINFDRLSGESKRLYFPKRYVAYVDYIFIEPELRKKYRNSDFYNLAINQETIAANPSIFKYNHLVFINGEYISTTEVYPQESKTGIIIDCISKNNNHGLTYFQWKEYRDTNPTVTIYMVPNYSIVNAVTNRYVLQDLNYNIPFDKIKGSESFNDSTICFSNTVDALSRRYYEKGIVCKGNNVIVNPDITPGGDKYRFSFITFNYLITTVELTKNNPYFRINTKLPCPTEQMLIFVNNGDNKLVLSTDTKIKLYYPNIYEIEGLEENQVVTVFIFQDDKVLSESEKYKNELAKYEEYVNMLPKFKDKTIPEIIKSYRPSSYVYSIDDYNNSMYVPSTMNYKAQKLQKTIYENPWALAVYLDLLNLPTDKFYIDMEQLVLEDRVRYSTENEEIDSGLNDIFFEEEHYVFAMNRHFINVKNYGFRIFIDGLFQREINYTIVPGPNFYYIYIPSKLIKPDSMIEIERYKLFSFEKVCSTDSIDTPIIEYDMSNSKQIGYSREVYVVDVESGLYLNKLKDFKVDVLYGYAEIANKWTTIPNGRNIPIENKFRVYLLNEKYVGKNLKVGITRTMAMKTGEVCENNTTEFHGRTIYEYAEVQMLDQGGYDYGGYRVFNNGKLLLPNQYFISFAKYQGGRDLVRTACKLYSDDQFTMDRVPCRFNVIYYQYEVDEENKKGYVDVDGKLALPISLKWYDIYLNGVKLHKKNIEIISPTKFYIQGTDSRKHLMIVTRNRDPEVFRLGPNNTIMDDLMNEVGGLKEIIDGTKSLIDPNDETREIATDVCKNLDALIFFYEYLVYSFINANKRQITQEIKDAFPSLINDQGIIEIDSNIGCIDDGSIGGYLIKLIECNYINDERSADMFTDENVNYDGLATLQDRFAIRPLDTTNYEFGLPKEFMCDPETGEPAIINDDGTVTTVSTLFRTKSFIESFSDRVIMYGMGKADIYQITMDNEFKVHVYNEGENLMTEEVSTEVPIKKFAIGIDASFLTKIGDSKMLKISDINPFVTIKYTEDNEEKTIKHKINNLINYAIDVNRKPVKITSIKIEGIPSNIKTFIHSILIAF